MKNRVVNIYDAFLLEKFKENITQGIVPELRQRQKIRIIKLASFISCVLLLSGCASVDKTLPLAPEPPELSQINSLNSDLSLPSAQAHSVMGQDIVHAVDVSQMTPSAGPLAVAAVSTVPSYCRVKDRFDRKAAIAYEWDRSRLALDVDGLGFDGGIDAMRVEYKLRIQPEKHKKAACRYKSAWQGVIGSGYNELILRQDDTVWEEVDEFKAKAKPYLDRFF